MTLPQILLPSSLPSFLAAGHEVDIGHPFVNVRNGTGHARKRATVTRVPRLATVAALFSSAEMAIFDTWFEDTLEAGARRFAARISYRGVGVRYWEAFWVEQPRMVPVRTTSDIMWRVSGRMALFGDPVASITFDPEIVASFGMGLEGNATIEASGDLAVQFGMGLEVGETTNLLEVRFGFGLEADLPLTARFGFGLEGSATIAETVATPASSMIYNKGATWDGLGVVLDPLQTKIIRCLPCQTDGTITSWTAESDVTGSCTVEVWKIALAADAQATAANKISASAPITLSSDTNDHNTTLTGWTTIVAKGDVLTFKLTSASSIGWLTVGVEIEE